MLSHKLEYSARCMGRVADALGLSEGSDDSTLLFSILLMPRIGDFISYCSFAGQHEGILPIS